MRDNKGHAIGNLSKEDFQLFDNGKPQVISRFTTEKMEVETAATKTQKPTTAETQTPLAPDGIPDRFTAYLFDDLHLGYSELKYTRDAAIKQIDSSPNARDRGHLHHLRRFIRPTSPPTAKNSTPASDARPAVSLAIHANAGERVPARLLLRGRPDL